MAPNAPPGVAFGSSNAGTVLLGTIASERGGTGSPAALLREHVLDPPDDPSFALRSTSLPPISSAAPPDPRPRGDMHLSKVGTIEGGAIPERDRSKAYDGTLLPVDHTDDNPWWARPAGGRSRRSATWCGTPSGS